MSKRRDPEIVARAIKRLMCRAGFSNVLMFEYIIIANELRSKAFKHAEPICNYERNIVCVKWLMRGVSFKALAIIREYIEQEKITPTDRKATKQVGVT